jgi:hypothetical protein
MQESEEETVKRLYKDKVGKKVLLRKKSCPDYVIVGMLQEIVGTKFLIQGNKDSYTVDYSDILSLDVKGKEKFEAR